MPPSTFPEDVPGELSNVVAPVIYAGGALLDAANKARPPSDPLNLHRKELGNQV